MYIFIVVNFTFLIVNFEFLKTLLYHDTFLMRGGAERLNIEIAKTLGADIATAIWSFNCYDARSM